MFENKLDSLGYFISPMNLIYYSGTWVHLDTTTFPGDTKHKQKKMSILRKFLKGYARYTNQFWKSWPSTHMVEKCGSNSEEKLKYIYLNKREIKKTACFGVFAEIILNMKNWVCEVSIVYWYKPLYWLK